MKSEASINHSLFTNRMWKPQTLPEWRGNRIAVKPWVQNQLPEFAEKSDADTGTGFVH